VINRPIKILLAGAIACSALMGGAAYAVQASTAAELRASGEAGEQANGYLGFVREPSAELRSRVNAVNIRRRSAYTQLATKRGVTVEEVAATMACEIFATAVQPGQYYRLPDGIWRRREGNAPVPRPAYCV
jgi:uncharacterized protein YdbL (DUF1318 family)